MVLISTKCCISHLFEGACEAILVPGPLPTHTLCWVTDFYYRACGRERTDKPPENGYLPAIQGFYLNLEI